MRSTSQPPVLIGNLEFRPWFERTAARFPEVEFRFGEPLKPDVVVVVTEDLSVPGPDLDSLRWVHLLSSGYDSFLGRSLPKPDLLLTNSSGAFTDGMSEFVLMRMLMHARKAERISDAQRHNEWRRSELGGITLRGKRLVVIGNGSVGGQVGRLAVAFGMRVLIAGRADRDRLHELVAEADYIVVASSLNPSSRGILNRELFHSMKMRPYLVNISRGALIETSALLEAVQTGLIAGAALDVFDTEPLPSDSPLYTTSGISVSPHVSGVFEEVTANLVEVFEKNLACFLKGEILPNRISIGG